MSLSNPNFGVLYEDIDETYAKYTWQDISIVFMKDNGYINTSICGKGKGFGRWYQTSSKNRQFVDYLCKKLGKTFDEVIIKKKQTKRTSNPQNPHETRGTYVHRYIFNKMLMSCSFDFSYKVMTMLDNWKELSQQNTNKYWKGVIEGAINQEEMSESNTESIIRDRIALEEKGETEVETKSGRIDVLTETKIIEVKVCRLWKHAMGQVLCYSTDYNDKLEPWLYLYRYKDCDVGNIKKVCAKFRVNVKFIEE